MNTPNYRVANIEDIPGMQVVRLAVKENVLSNPALIQDHDYIPFITTCGKGWVCEIDNEIAGFAIVDVEKENIWALFILPKYEGQGMGKILQKLMLDWYFTNDKTYVWLGTSPHTRAEKFYTRSGWTKNGWHGDEVKFELSNAQWEAINT